MGSLRDSRCRHAPDFGETAAGGRALSGDCFANSALRSRFVDTTVEFRCIRRVSQERFHDPTSRFPSLAPAGNCSPASAVLSKRYDFLPPIPPHFVTFAWRYLSVHSFFSLPHGRVGHLGLELVTRFSSRDAAEETTGSPKFLENLSCPFAHVPIRLRQDCLHQTITMLQRGPWSINCKGSRERSFEAPLHGFRTRCLRFAGRVATYDARLASGRWSGVTGRAFHPQGPAERFQICILHLIPLSQASLGTMKSPGGTYRSLFGRDHRRTQCDGGSFSRAT